MMMTLAAINPMRMTTAIRMGSMVVIGEGRRVGRGERGVVGDRRGLYRHPCGGAAGGCERRISGHSTLGCSLGHHHHHHHHH